jgi:hypothetical protein
MPDAKELLLGSGKQTRYIRVETARQLAHPDVKVLIAAAIDRAGVSVAIRGRGKLVAKSGANKPTAPPEAVEVIQTTSR